MRRNEEPPQRVRTESGYRPIQGMTEAGKAESLGIPSAHRERPNVQEFVSLATRLDNLVAELGASEDRHLYDAKLARIREELAAPDMTIPLNARYAAAKDLVLAAKVLLEEGVGPVPTDDYKGFLATRMNRALERVGGYEVVKTGPGGSDPQTGSRS